MRSAPLDVRVEVEADGEGVLAAAADRLPDGRHEGVDALEAVAGVGQAELALVDDARSARHSRCGAWSSTVAPASARRSTSTRVGPATIASPSQSPIQERVRKRQDEVSLRVTVEWAAVVRARRRSEAGARRRHAAIDDQALAADAHLEGQAAGMGADARSRSAAGGRRRRATIVPPASMRW